MIAKVKSWVTDLVKGVRSYLEGELAGANRYLVIAKILGITVFLFGTNYTPRARMGILAWFIVGTIWALSVVVILHVAFFSRIAGRIVWSIALIAAAFVGAGFHIIYDLPLNLFDVDRLLGNLDEGHNVLPFYGPMLTGPAAYCLIGVVAINLPFFAKRAKNNARGGVNANVKGRAKQLLFQSTPIWIIAIILVLKRGEATNGFAVQHSVWSFLVVLAGERVAQGPKPTRQPVTMTVATTPSPSGLPPFKTIIVVMDESGKGAALDLNSPDGVESGLKNRPDAVNFGIMCAIANCSYETNVSFRFGVGREDYITQLYANPSMWSYAKAAGFTTFYVDGQRSEGRLQTGMDYKEKKAIDHHLQLSPTVLAEEKDGKLAELLRKTIREQEGKPSFMYVQKMGSHFPYEGKYPADQALLKPTMERTYFGTEADPRPSRLKAASEEKAPDIRLRFKNSYYNSLRWNTKRFFDILLDGLDLSETVIVFMADHGQDLHQDNRPGFNTHCSTGDDAHPDQGRVFFVLLTQNQERLASFKEMAARSYDKTSQWSVFPSMLEWMGYPRDQIAANKNFDPPLDAPPAKDNQRYISKYFVRLGSKPIWNTCTLKE